MACSTSAADGPARAPGEMLILPLGDSITQGMPTDDGYRAALRDEMRARGVKLRFVGSLESAAGKHEGWIGFTADELTARVEEALAGPPDVVLLHIGTNDIGLGQDGEGVARDVERLLERIHRRAPRATVLLAQIVPMALAGERFEREVRRLNARLPEVAARRRRAGQRIEIVDLHAEIDLARDFHDAIHPGASGYAKIGRAWAAAVLRTRAK